MHEAEQLTEDQLQNTLPTSADLPAIFTPTEGDDSRDDDKSFLCGVDVEDPGQRNARASVGYGAQVGVSATHFSFGISQFDSPEAAAAQIRATGRAIDSCDRFESHGDTYTVAPMRAAVGRGQDSVAVRLTARSAGFAVAVNVVLVRTGPSLVASLSATIGLAGGSTVDDLVRLTQDTVDRYEAAAGIA